MQNVVSKLWWISENCGAAKTFKAPQKCFFFKDYIEDCTEVCFSLCIYLRISFSHDVYLPVPKTNNKTAKLL